MRNLKHTIIAVAAVVMVGTLSVFQASDMSADKQARDMKLSTANQIENITIASTETEEGTRALALPLSDEDAAAQDSSATDAETERAIEEKSYHTLGYANVTGSAELKTSPSESAETAGSMNGADQVEILESTDGWYKVSVNGTDGYVESDKVTLDKGEAKESALKYDHYRKASIDADTGLTVRAEGSSDAESVDSVSDGDDVIIVDQSGDYLKILYGDDYKEGYVITSGVESSDEWVEKDEVHSEIKRIAAEKEAAAEKERIAKENARSVSSAYSTTDGEAASVSGESSDGAAESNTSESSSSTGGGQALVDEAMKYLGVPYVWGGTTPNGFDCSGLVQYVCNANGISVPRVASAQRTAGQYVSRENLQPGDLVFFSNGSDVSHVGIYCGDGNMIHAPQTGDVVKVSSIETSYRISHYAGAVRVW